MKFAVVFLSLICLYYSRPVQAQVRQIGGKDASVINYPFMAAISLARTLMGNGAIIQSRWILTSASAVYFTQDSLYDVQVGADTFKGTGNWYEVLRIYRHSEYIGWDHNIALIQLKGHIKYTSVVQPIDLAVTDTDFLEAVMLSYGFNEQGTAHLREGTYKLTATDECVNFVIEDIAKNMIRNQQGYCVFPLSSTGQGQWANDAGAPMVAYGQLYGLFAFAEHRGGINQGSVATRVFKFTNWIQGTITANGACICCTTTIRAQTRQIGGKDVSIQQYPFVAAIAYARQPIGNGAIIAPKWILTSASAVYYYPDNEYDVAVGATDFYGNAKWFKVWQIYKHTEFVGWDDNIAMVLIRGVIQYSDTVQPIDISTSFPDTIEVTMLSYGRNEDGTTHLRAATYTLISDNTDCISLLKADVAKEVIWKQNGFCMIPPPGTEQGQWFDDAGAPMVAEVCALTICAIFVALVATEQTKRQVGDALIIKYPFIVAITFNNNFAGNGVIVAGKWILSTATVFANSPDTAYQAHAGSSNYLQDSTVNGVQRVIRHPQYDGSGNNIALAQMNDIFLETQLLKSVDLGINDVPSASTTMATFGGTAQLQEVINALASDESCISQLYDEANKRIVQEGLAYCVTLSSDYPIGSGDLGAPIMSMNFLYGLYADGLVATRIAIYRGWIQSTMQENP
uniref:Peptidase S1 domain-containing protein n=1 Tax=Anopheles minimus TaxID=112268 RepID=A0A182WL51_9DIPT